MGEGDGSPRVAVPRPLRTNSVESMGPSHVYAVVAGEEPQRLHVRDSIERGQTLRELPAVPALAEVHPGFVPCEECLGPPAG